MARNWTKGDTFLTFRGESDVLVHYTIDTSGPGSGCEVEWMFSDSRLRGIEVTEAEEEEIIAKCIEDYNDGIYDD